MTKASRVLVTSVLLVGVLCPQGHASAQERPAIADQIAKTYGLDSFGQVEAIRYTFDAEVPALKVKLSRSWVWEPKTDQISFDGKDKAGNPVKVTYLRSQLASQSAVVKDEVEPAFWNDQYNLMFPFHLVWDAGAKVEDTGMHKLPLGKGSARRLVVTYASQGGYTPGDVWELYVGSDNRVREYVYRRGGDLKPTGIFSTWQEEGYKKVGPLLFSLQRRGLLKGKPLRIVFSNVAVKLAGSSSWVDAN